MGTPREVLLGRLAVERGLITKGQLARALEEQARRGDASPFGRILLDLEILTQDDLDELLLAQQENLAAPSPYSDGITLGEDLLGNRAVEAGFVTADQLNECLRLQGLQERKGKLVRIGEVLVAKGYLGVEQVRQLLATQGKRIFRCQGCGVQYNVLGHTIAAPVPCRKCGGALAEVAQAPSPADGRDQPAVPTDASPIQAVGTWHYAATPIPMSPPPLPEAPPHPPAPPKPLAPPKPRYVDYRRRRDARRGPANAVIAGIAAVLVVAGLFLMLRSSSDTPKRGRDTASSTREGDQPTEPPASSPSVEAQWRDFLATLPADDPAGGIRSLHRLDPSGPLGARAREEIGRREEAYGKQLAEEFDRRREAARELASRDEWATAIGAWDGFPFLIDLKGEWNEKVAKEVDSLEDKRDTAFHEIITSVPQLFAGRKQAEAEQLLARLSRFGYPWAAEKADHLRQAAQAPSPAGDPEVSKAERRVDGLLVLYQDVVQSRREKERREGARRLAQVEILISSHRYTEALRALDSLAAITALPEFRARIGRLREEVEPCQWLIEEFLRQADDGRLTDRGAVFGEAQLSLSRADAVQVVFAVNPGSGEIRRRWTELTAAQAFDLLRRMKLDEAGRFRLASFCASAAPKGLRGEAIGRLLSLLKKDAARWGERVNLLMARLDGLPQAPSGGYVAYKGSLVSVEERDNREKGLVLYLGKWVTKEEKGHREAGEYPVKLANGDTKWVKDEAELKELGLIYYAKKGCWYTAEEYALLRHDWDEAYEGETTHYEIHTNIGEAYLEKMKLLLEQAYAIYQVEFGFEPKAGRKMVFYLFSSREDYEAFCTKNTEKQYNTHLNAGGFADPTDWFCCGYAMEEDGDATVTETAMHEGCHLFFGVSVDYTTPSWYSEGMATGFENYRWDGTTGKLTVDPLALHYATHARSDAATRRALPLADLLEGDAHTANNTSQSAAEVFYSEAWALYYYLRHSGAPEVDEVRKKLDALFESGAYRGQSGESVEVFRRAAGDVASFEKGFFEFVLKLPTGP